MKVLLRVIISCPFAFSLLYGLMGLSKWSGTEGLYTALAVIILSGGVLLFIWGKQKIYLWGVMFSALGGTMLLGMTGFHSYMDSAILMAVGFGMLTLGLLIITIFTFAACISGKQPKNVSFRSRVNSTNGSSTFHSRTRP
ncbi:hypothetical protein LRR81_17115 [Metabacillus sp. GX 13764]|uniref:hypothetical protein n=1 Tax=Metabacillus kandeliae TaxID=2900151 RepID=UPI001E2C2F3A|nr:hypothetical protein [Metabacillus kandeliae]MCD7035967.1 hypothetical protein [Metabacillus kandeliae]